MEPPANDEVAYAVVAEAAKAAPKLPRRPGKGSEVMLRRVGGWAKRIALMGYMNDIFGRLTRVQAVAIYAAAIIPAVWKILTDETEPYGTRRYIANMCGDDDAILLLRHHQPRPGCTPHVPWIAWRGLLLQRRSVIQKAVATASFAIWRQRFTLSFFWGFTLTKRLLQHAMNKNKGQARTLFRALFPKGLLQFLGGCGRTVGFIGAMPFIFWNALGLCEKANLPGGVSQPLITALITLSGLGALLIEDPIRYQACAAFTTVSILD